jgi:secondary thiamine-phosphate synthase enzyme
MGGTEILDVKTTTRTEMIDITTLVRAAIRRSGVDDGIACVFCPHTTAAVTIQENTDPSVKRDMVGHLGKLVPRDAGFEHAVDNSDAHIKSSVVGASLTLIVEGGKPVLGPWQAVFFCEYDGPRSRRVLVRVVAG